MLFIWLLFNLRLIQILFHLKNTGYLPQLVTYGVMFAVQSCVATLQSGLTSFLFIIKIKFDGLQIEIIKIKFAVLSFTFFLQFWLMFNHGVLQVPLTLCNILFLYAYNFFFFCHLQVEVKGPSIFLNFWLIISHPANKIRSCKICL